jgi:UDPglucose 6-dehydrogenase
MLAVPKKKIHLTVYSSSNMRKEIIIAGYGYVGKAVGNALSKSIVHVIDPKYSNTTIDQFPNANGIVICVGTPSNPIGDCDISQITNVLDLTPVSMPVMIKSTVPPDLLENILKKYPRHIICYSPELLRSATANSDFLNQKYMVIGGNDPDLFWQTLFQDQLPNCQVFFNTSIIEASMIKYATNCFLSVKVSFFNQIYDLCQQNGADFNLVRQALSHDARIGSSHTLVPGPDGSRGFGGGCFPKDTNAFIHYSDRMSQSHTLVESAVKYNKKVRKNP